MSTAGYADDVYGYGSYGSDAYDRAYTDDLHPNATSYLSGPGSSASVGGNYAHNYASENARGGIYTENTSYYATDLTQVRSYSYHGAGYSFTSNDTSIDYQVQTPGSPLGDGTHYGPAIPYGYGALDSIDLYSSDRTTSSGSATYTVADSVTTEQFGSGYAISYHSTTTSESENGQVVAGSEHMQSYATLSDSYGDTSAFTPHTYGYGYSTV